MTSRLYYDDAYCREFDGMVVGVEQKGSRQVVRLDRSSFYPTSGGQPHDTGSIDSLRVVDVVDEGGDVVHILEGELSLTAGRQVHGRIDWPRRFDHMQQHTGQHVLSAACVRLFGVRTESVHLGTEASTIDLARELTAVEIAAAEDESNRIVWEDRPVRVRYAAAEEAATLGLRKPSDRVGTLRLVDIEQFDLSACGGSHVARTGEIGVVAVGSWERFKGGQRLEFLCGGRALSRFRGLRDVTSKAVRLLSVHPDQLPAAIEHLQADAREGARLRTLLEGELGRYRAADLSRTAADVGGLHLVLRRIDGEATSLKTLAAAVIATPGFLAILVSRTEPAVLVVAKSKEVNVRCDEVVAALIREFGGRGGGRSDMAQAGGLNGDPDAILAAARRLVLRESAPP